MADPAPDPLITAAALLNDQKWERVRYILTYSASGGLAIILALVLVWVLVTGAKQSQTFTQTEYLDTLRQNTASNTLTAKVMEDVGEAMEDTADAQKEVATALEKLTMTIERNQKTDEEVSRMIIEMIEQERDEEAAEHASVNSVNPP